MCRKPKKTSYFERTSADFLRKHGIKLYAYRKFVILSSDSYIENRSNLSSHLYGRRTKFIPGDNNLNWKSKRRACEAVTTPSYLYMMFQERYEWKTINTVSENQRFCVADFATLSDERRSRSKTVLLFNTDKRTLRSKIWGAHTFENSWDFANWIWTTHYFDLQF